MQKRALIAIAVSTPYALLHLAEPIIKDIIGHNVLESAFFSRVIEAAVLLIQITGSSVSVPPAAPSRWILVSNRRSSRRGCRLRQQLGLQTEAAGTAEGNH